ncbi:unnamed protein product [Anisakis simplex]|uniref:Ovule protein n=1 Tax=Anisakis simplex TaxID=6269 RepID=A0A0M3JSJ4_ANISI|nr:unnamed protein product [Anisakis simplex]
MILWGIQKHLNEKRLNPSHGNQNRRYVDSGVVNENFSSAYIDSHQGTSAAFHPSFYPDKRLLTWRAPHLRKQQPLKKSLEVDANSGITCESHSETKSKLSSSHHDSLKPSTKSISSAEKPVPASVPRSNGSPKNVIYIPDDWYSDVNSLSKDDLEQFEADSFDLEKVPEVPPPRHLC